MILRLSEEAVFRKFDGDPSAPRVTCEVPQGRSKFRCLVPQDVSELLHRFDGTRTVEEVVGAHCQGREAKAASRQKLTQLVENYFVPNGVLVGSDAAPRATVENRKPHYVRFALPLLRGKIIRALVTPLGALFQGPFIVAMLSASAAAHLAFYSTHSVRQLADITTLPLPDAAIIVALMVFSAFAHELGHAAALVRHGGDAREIGFAVYLMRPVLYTNVTDSWRLSRPQRMQVDAGGMYFDAIFLAMLFAAAWLLPSRALAFSFVWIDLMLIASLNPVLRMDGYWLLADLAGSSGLREESVAALRNYLLSFRRQSSTGQRLPARKRMFLVAYAFVSVGVFAWTYGYFTVMLWTVVVPKYQGLLKQLIEGLQQAHVTGATGAIAAARALVILLWTTMMILAFAGFALHALRRVTALGRSFAAQKGYAV